MLMSTARTRLLPQIIAREGIFINEVTLPWLFAFSDEMTLLPAIIAAFTSTFRHPSLLFASPTTPLRVSLSAIRLGLIHSPH